MRDTLYTQRLQQTHGRTDIHRHRCTDNAHIYRPVFTRTHTHTHTHTHTYTHTHTHTHTRARTHTFNFSTQRAERVSEPARRPPLGGGLPKERHRKRPAHTYNRVWIYLQITPLHIGLCMKVNMDSRRAVAEEYNAVCARTDLSVRAVALSFARDTFSLSRARHLVRLCGSVPLPVTDWTGFHSKVSWYA